MKITRGCNHGGGHALRLLRPPPITPSLHPLHPLPTTPSASASPLTPSASYTLRLLHPPPLTPSASYTLRQLHPAHTTPFAVYTLRLLHPPPFTPSASCTVHLLHRPPLAPSTASLHPPPPYQPTGVALCQLPNPYRTRPCLRSVRTMSICKKVEDNINGVWVWKREGVGIRLTAVIVFERRCSQYTVASFNILKKECFQAASHRIIVDNTTHSLRMHRICCRSTHRKS